MSNGTFSSLILTCWCWSWRYALVSSGFGYKFQV